MEMNRNRIKQIIKNNSIIWRKHALQRMFERGITRDEIKRVIIEGKIIEEYVDDKPFPSKLFYQKFSNRVLHVVAAFDEETNKLHVITSYEPSLEIFENDFKKRKKR